MTDRISPRDMFFPISSLAPEGQAATHCPQAVQRDVPPMPSSLPGVTIDCGHTFRHCPQSWHRSSKKATCGSGLQHSGLQHQVQRSGQPLKKMTVRMPGPSLPDQRWSSVITASRSRLHSCWYRSAIDQKSPWLYRVSYVVRAMIASWTSFDKVTKRVLYPATLTSRS